MSSYACPKGHESTESDFCSECGAKIPANGATPASAIAGTQACCPDCGTVRLSGETVFCEICGFNFETGAHGEIPVSDHAAVPAPNVPPATQPADVPPALEIAPDAPAEPLVTNTGWTLIVTVDPALREAGSPPPPADTGPFTFDLKKDLNLIGRTSQSRAIFPEVALDFDDAVSHRHALLNSLDGGKLTLRDIGSSNGTRLNGHDVEPLTDVELHPGDELTLGHWTRVAVKAKL